jgi:hypothetical protein
MRAVFDAQPEAVRQALLAQVGTFLSEDDA